MPWAEQTLVGECDLTRTPTRWWHGVGDKGASTNEREGSQIAREIVHALVERGAKVDYVTHLYDLADGFHRDRPVDALFLRAERGDDGNRTFRLVEAPPLPTSFGRDVYRRVFGEAT